jgi:RimJ/RimL family protein N-acetyltransferase
MNDFEKNIKEVISSFKTEYHEDPDKYSLAIKYKDEIVGRLRPIPIDLKADAAQDAVLQTNWRNLYKDSFMTEPFTATVPRTIKWLEGTYNNDDGKIVFMIESNDKTPVGHVGVENFDFEKKVCESGRLIRGDRAKIELIKRINLISLGQFTMIKWAFDVLKLEKIYARQFVDNYVAYSMNINMGFHPVRYFTIAKHNGEFDMVEIEITKDTLRA